MLSSPDGTERDELRITQRDSSQVSGRVRGAPPQCRGSVQPLLWGFSEHGALQSCQGRQERWPDRGALHPPQLRPDSDRPQVPATHRLPRTLSLLLLRLLPQGDHSRGRGHPKRAGEDGMSAQL